MSVTVYVVQTYKGRRVDVKGKTTDVKGKTMDVKGQSVDVKGNRVMRCLRGLTLRSRARHEHVVSANIFGKR
eukprot:6707198-Pyramimonas_sp.AAC.1